MKYAYPVIFTQAPDIIMIDIPDLDILTDAPTMKEARATAAEAISEETAAYLADGEAVPAASDKKAVKAKDGVFADLGKSQVELIEVEA